MRQGFGLLDEKRILTAGEIRALRNTTRCSPARRLPLRLTARDALAAAVERHGIDVLRVDSVRTQHRCRRWSA